jgi:hypothetical protein
MKLPDPRISLTPLRLNLTSFDLDFIRSAGYLIELCTKHLENLRLFKLSLILLTYASSVLTLGKPHGINGFKFNLKINKKFWLKLLKKQSHNSFAN